MDIFFALFLGLASGIGYYFFDKKRMQGWHRTWYDLTHKNPLPKATDIGFVYGQPFSGKFYSAAFLAAVLTLIIIATGSANIFVQAVYGLFILLGVLVAFYVTPLIMKHGVTTIKHVQEGLERIDEMEINLGKKEKETQPETKKEEAPEAPRKKGPDTGKDDWRKGLRDMLDD